MRDEKIDFLRKIHPLFQKKNKFSKGSSYCQAGCNVFEIFVKHGTRGVRRRGQRKATVIIRYFRFVLRVSFQEAGGIFSRLSAFAEGLAL